MDDTSVTRIYLEGLSSGELLQLADRFGIDIPFGLERIFIIEELLENAFVSNDTPELGDIIHSDFLEAVALPRQYNISFVEVIIRDPLWALVLWEIKGHDREFFESASDFDGYFLKVIPVAVSKEAGGAGDMFMVPVGVDDTAWYVGFPPAEGRYRVELCARKGGRYEPIIVSRPFRLPRLLELPGQNACLPDDFQNAYDNPLICLSGARDFSVVRSVEREARARGI